MDEAGNVITGLLFSLSLAIATLLRDADLEDEAVSGKALVYLSRFSALNDDGIEP